jgi:hypothetical protein
MFVRNAPVAIDFAQSHSEPEKKTVLVHGVAGRIGSTPHDGYREGDLRARRNGEFSEVEGCAGFVVTKKTGPTSARMPSPPLEALRSAASSSSRCSLNFLVHLGAQTCNMVLACFIGNRCRGGSHLIVCDHVPNYLFARR